MKPYISFFFTELLSPSLIINLAKLISPSVALPAELVDTFIANISAKMLRLNLKRHFMFKSFIPNHPSLNPS